MEAMYMEYVMDQVIHARRAFLTKSNYIFTFCIFELWFYVIYEIILEP